MTEPHRPRVKYVIGPDGSPLTIADLPPPTTKRWVISRKAEVVAAVRGGLLSLEEACARYTLTVEEFKALSGDVVQKQFEMGTLVKTEQAVVTKVNDSYARGKNADHHVGLPNVIVWSERHSGRKRRTPIGVAFVESYSNDGKS